MIKALLKGLFLIMIVGLFTSCIMEVKRDVEEKKDVIEK